MENLMEKLDIFAKLQEAKSPYPNPFYYDGMTLHQIGAVNFLLLGVALISKISGDSICCVP
jgi:hypothetical protein